MLTKSKIRVASLSLTAGLIFGGCSGGDDTAVDPTASTSPSPQVSATVTATPTPTNTLEPNLTPLGGKPATEEEKQYHQLQQKAQGLFLSRSYKDAIPLLEQAVELRPDDVENHFYLLLSHGSLEMVPSKSSAAYPYAEKVAALGANSTEAGRARAYLVGANMSIPDDFKYGKNTFFTKGAFVYDPGTPYKLSADAPLHNEVGARLGKDGKATLWEAEISPEMVKNTIPLSKGSEVQILSEQHFYYGLTSWRKPLPQSPKEKDLNKSIFELNAFYVEVVSDGDNKGKKGWLVNQVDRYVSDEAADPYGTWIPDRLSLPRESDQET